MTSAASAAAPLAAAAAERLSTEPFPAARALRFDADKERNADNEPIRRRDRSNIAASLKSLKEACLSEPQHQILINVKYCCCSYCSACCPSSGRTISSRGG
jgi:hypothetical protein